MSMTSFTRWIARLMLLSACACHWAGLGVQAFRSESKAGDVVERSAIHGVAPFGVCEHHPDGCPRVCLCPKIDPAGRDGDGESLGRVREPSLVNCTAQGPMGELPAFDMFIPGSSALPQMPVSDAPLLIAYRGAPLSFYRDPPEKIPI
jgi:hypothetical protein